MLYTPSICARSSRIVLKITIVLFALFCTLFGCERPSQVSSAPKTFGTDAVGFVIWLSADGSRTVVMQFDRDTNADHKITHRIGEHGELLADEPTPVMFDTRTGASQAYDAFIATDARRTVALMIQDQKLVLVNGLTGVKTVLPQADLRQDLKNRCLPPRVASISPNGDTVAWITSEQDVHVRSKSGEVISTSFSQPIWRTEQSNVATTVYVQGEDTDGNGRVEFPSSSGTCGCWWCPRFARSVGRYAQTGDSPKKIQLSNGKKMAVQTPIGLSSREVLQPTSGCKPVGKHQGQYSVFQCEDGLFVYNTVDPKPKSKQLPNHVRLSDPSYIAHGDYFPVYAVEKTGRHLARIDLRKPGHVELGPKAGMNSAVISKHGWWVTKSELGIVAWNMETGARKTIVLAEVSFIDGLIVTGKEHAEDNATRMLINPETGRLKTIEQDVDLVARNGCAIQKRNTNRMQRGPFLLICP